MLMTYAHRLMVVELPAMATQEGEERFPSIWKLFAITVYNRIHGAVACIDLLQGHFGGQSPESTSLLVSSGPPLDAAATIIISFQATSLPAALVMGWQDDLHEFANAKLKNYPGDLCRALSGLARQWLDIYVQDAIVVDLGCCMDEFLVFSEKLLQGFTI